jgi:hypothetical protein
MIEDKTYLNIIVDAESKIFEGESRNKLLSDYYIDAFKVSNAKKDFYTNLLKVIGVFKEDLEEQRHEHKVLMDVVPERIIYETIKIELNRYEPDKKYWRFDYPLEAYRIKQHKKSILLASKTISSKINEENKHENLGWFQVGLLFASGKMDKLIKEYNSNATSIAKSEFGNNWAKYRPYISSSFNETSISERNIFNSRKKLLIIIKHCKKRNIDVTTSFIKALPPE